MTDTSMNGYDAIDPELQRFVDWDNECARIWAEVAARFYPGRPVPAMPTDFSAQAMRRRTAIEQQAAHAITADVMRLASTIAHQKIGREDELMGSMIEEAAGTWLEALPVHVFRSVAQARHDWELPSWPPSAAEVLAKGKGWWLLRPNVGPKTWERLKEAATSKEVATSTPPRRMVRRRARLSRPEKRARRMNGRIGRHGAVNGDARER